MKILALDPGSTTGFALLEWGGTEPTPSMLQGFGHIDFDAAPKWLDSLVQGELRPDLIVYERFYISPRTVQFTRQPDPLYVIGGTIFLARIHGIPIRSQAAADAKTAWPNARLKEEGFKVRGDHARDAVRHALLATLSSEVYDLYTDTDKIED